jgi:hypothetical protein
MKNIDFDRLRASLKSQDFNAMTVSFGPSGDLDLAAQVALMKPSAAAAASTPAGLGGRISAFFRAPQKAAHGDFHARFATCVSERADALSVMKQRLNDQI